MTEVKLSPSLEHSKRLLRVRGIDAVEAEIKVKHKLLDGLMEEAQELLEGIKALKLVYSVYLIKKVVNYQYMRQHEKIVIPMMLFGFLDKNSAKNPRSRQYVRRNIFTWDAISREIDRCNLSLDERLGHIAVFMATKETLARGRQLADDLRYLYALRHDFEDILRQENISIKQVPDWMIRGNLPETVE